MNDINPKVQKVLQLFEEGLKVEEVAPKVGYSHPKSLSRFMSQHGYRWDTQLGNYIISEVIIEQTPDLTFVLDEEVEEDKPVLKTYDGLFEKFIDLVKEFENKGTETNLHDRDFLNFWKKAQKYRKSSTYSIVKSFRITEEIEGKLARFSKQTHLSQKQIICMALDDFMEHYEEEAI
ncbi:hypothetical protein [Fictibacillus phosphorivorans]|uniref:hypothetical protein n=1 Tax=Fictibacillus phosphorivorans TaxID=1221500 RepID=UPI00129304B6|nr:hypothetical protein [Fictibacillus phosphorivorans]MQR94772.1 hypothetical protein [Fictibacillus phosphorivorans]